MAERMSKHFNSLAFAVSADEINLEGPGTVFGRERIARSLFRSTTHVWKCSVFFGKTEELHAAMDQFSLLSRNKIRYGQQCT